LAGTALAQTVEEVATWRSTTSGSSWPASSSCSCSPGSPRRGGIHPGQEHGEHRDEELHGLRRGSADVLGVGFGLAYGGSTIGGYIGYGEFFFNNPERSVEWFFQVVFAATAATIVSGAMAERTKFSAYLVYTRSSPA
jgi:hypothetical protein